MPRVSLGFRVHSGWAVMIALAGNTVVERWRIELAGDGMPVQPYHAAEPLPFAEAGLLIRNCAEISLRFAMQVFERLSGHEVHAACVLASSGRPLPDLKAILASHALIHTAEGELYRDALRRAASHFKVPLVQAKEKEVLARVPAQF